MAVKLSWSVLNVVVLVVVAGFLITIFQAASVESDEKKTEELVENSDKTVEGAGVASWDKVKRWTSLVSDKLPKSLSFKKTAAPASQDSDGIAETATQKTGEKIKQTDGKAPGEL